MKRHTIIWDFDGTILPLEPFDSEQSLLMHRMQQPENPFGWFKKGIARAIIYMDQRERFRRTFKKSYIQMLKGTPSSVLDEVSRQLADKISSADRRALRALKDDGHDMMVLSCGTADLSERTLKLAELHDCFRLVDGNRFQFDKDRIYGMDLRLPNPDDKLDMVRRLKLSPDRTIIVGDGYTDLPLLNWTSIPVVIDRTGRKKKQFAFQRFYFITSIPEITGLLKNLSTRNEQEIS